ncbi:hypothetical protein BP6252_14173 [Coleophoma cylindrospora]|uniref:Uncharacterized protein n=1 Tax=Coleophoma cylindrospora TaxID=1849047 RepID=A0A3D8Q3Y0_9HELO|nr:hypothetical protein BP6252_14173 [Coleophoma cylindrospora]
MESLTAENSHIDWISFKDLSHSITLEDVDFQLQSGQQRPIDEELHLTSSSRLSITDERRSAAAPISGQKDTHMHDKNKWENLKDRLQDSWAPEVLASITSLLALLTIVALLWYFRGKSIPIVVLYNMSLGTILSILATILKTTIFVPISAGFGQIIWIKLHRQGLSLRDVDQLYSASHGGAFSGFEMLSRKTNSYRAYIAAFLYILSFAIGPTIQATTVSKQLAGQPFLQRCETNTNSNISPASTLYSELEKVLGEYSSTRTSDQSLQELQRGCSTGDCDWPTFSSLAICSNSTDISSKIVQTSYAGHYDYSLPNNLSLLNMANDFVAINASTSLPTLHYEEWGSYPIVKYSILSYYSNPSFVVAAEGVLYWCVQGYNTSVKGYALRQNVTSSWYDIDAADPTSSSLTLSPPPETWPSLGMHKSTNFTVTDLDAYTAYISSALDSSTTSEELRQISWNGVRNISSLFDTLASRMSNRLRASVCDLHFPGVESDLDIVLVIRWGWLIIPTTIILLAIALLATVMVQSHYYKVKLWKTSLLALLFHGLSVEIRNKYSMSEVEDLRRMEEVSEKVVVSLRGQGRDHKESGLLLRHQYNQEQI